MAAPLPPPTPLFREVVGGEPAPTPEAVVRPKAPDMDANAILQMCKAYLEEGREGRSSGDDDRDDVWRRNVDAYWSRYDFSKKANWQAKEVIPVVHNSVQRFGSSMRTALKQSGDWYVPEDPQDSTGLFSPIVKKFVDFFLDRSGTNSSGHTVSFDHTFGELMIGGALKMPVAVVTWNAEKKTVDVESIDASSVWLDPTGRKLYRVRETEMDYHLLVQRKKLRDVNGKPIFHAAAIDRLKSTAGTRTQTSDLTNDKNRMSGGQQEISSSRRPIRLHEFLCDVLNAEGELVAKNQLIIMGDEREIIRGPEPNPFWHKKDWVVASPMVNVPWSVYGRSYVESFTQLAATFTEITNMILDAVRTSSLNAFMAYPQALEDPTQLNDGIHPNKTFIASEDWDPSRGDFIKPIGLGRLPPEAFQTWSGIKDLMQEAASENEIGLGQLAPKSGTTATEIVAAGRGSNQITANIAADVEATILGPILELVWMTALQHSDPMGDPELRQVLGPLAPAFAKRKQEFRDRKFKMHVSGLSGLLDRSEKGRQLLGMLNVVGSNPLLLQAYQQEFSIPKTLNALIATSGVDPSTIKLGPNEQPVQLPVEADTGPGDLRQTNLGGGSPGVSGAQGPG